MSHAVVSIVADARPAQKGVETDAHAFDDLMGAAALDALQELFGDSLALAGLSAQADVKVEPASDRVKLSVEGGPGASHARPHAASAVRS
jgi:hypothetical protein